MPTRTIAGVAAFLFCAGLSPAFAHAKLVQSSPAADSTVAAPRAIRLTFSEKIVPAFSGLQLSMGDGMTVSASTSLSDDGKTLTARPTSPFMAGKWTLSWHATAADDGHKTEGSYSFTVK
ncbi:MAG TPA: copper homeostasis periplasmic binding protein CopC [Rhizomicrobium sp.]|nr:copper homeostasis periplasmic binding protein CopC [Rhizomicrobium sp.]